MRSPCRISGPAIRETAIGENKATKSPAANSSPVFPQAAATGIAPEACADRRHRWRLHQQPTPAELDMNVQEPEGHSPSPLWPVILPPCPGVPLLESRQPAKVARHHHPQQRRIPQFGRSARQRERVPVRCITRSRRPTALSFEHVCTCLCVEAVLEDQRVGLALRIGCTNSLVT